MATKKASPAQIAWRKKFAAMAKAGTLKKRTTRKKNPAAKPIARKRNPAKITAKKKNPIRVSKNMRVGYAPQKFVSQKGVVKGYALKDAENGRFYAFAAKKETAVELAHTLADNIKRQISVTPHMFHESIGHV